MSRHNKNLCLAALLLVAYALGASAHDIAPAAVANGGGT